MKAEYVRERGEAMAEQNDFEEIYEEDYGQEYEEDTEEKLPPLATAGIFLGLVVLAAIICAILWNVTHREEDTDMHANATETVQEESVEETIEEVVIEEEPATSEEGGDEMTGDESSGAVADGAGMTGDESSGAVTDGAGMTGEGVADAEDLGKDTAGDLQVEGASEQEPISGTESMRFVEASDTMTAKDVTNLRSVPSTLDSENIVAQLLNGETITRTGLNDDTGWSRLEYNGQTVYAVTRYLTTDLSYKPPVAPSDPNRITTQEGRVILFANIDDYVTPKEYVNLRTEPSTFQGQATAKCQISNGTVVHRTGYSADSGWSRVEYNGEVLYVVSSMVNNAAAPE